MLNISKSLKGNEPFRGTSRCQIKFPEDRSGKKKRFTSSNGFLSK